MADGIAPVAALAMVRRRLAADPSAVTLVDGRSGSGKSTFASALEGSGVRLLRLDDVYPGWDGLQAASDRLVDRVLRCRSRGVPALLRRWDWAADRPGEAFAVPTDGPLVVEGCGALSRRSAALADLTVWIELGTADRRRRALARDGDAFAPHWERWARQERRMIARDGPRSLADLVVDGRRYPQRTFGGRTGDTQYP